MNPSTLKMTVFWDVAPCSLVEVYECLRGAYCVHHQGDEATSTTEKLVKFYQTAWCRIPEDSHLHACHCENLKSHPSTLFFSVPSGKLWDITMHNNPLILLGT
jgi:hypothetical protein